MAHAGTIAGILLLASLGIDAAARAAEYKAPAHHPAIERLARDTAYRGGNSAGGPQMAQDPELTEHLGRNNLKLEDHIDDPKTGMQAMVLRDGKTKDTYILFRGTWPNARDGSFDAIADADMFGDTGASQYNAHRAKLDSWARKFPNSIVSGHSLGAALGQRFTADHPDKVREGVFFNAPAIDKVHAERFARAPKQPPVTTYVGGSVVPSDVGIPIVFSGVATTVSPPRFDIVSEFGGRSHLPGRIVESLNLNPPSSFVGIMGANHTDYMLDGKGQRKTEEIPYEQYEERREDTWRNSESLLQNVRTALQLGDAAAGTLSDWSDVLIPGARQGAAMAGRAVIPEEMRTQLGTLAQSVAGITQGFGKTGPSGPSPRMVAAGNRDCALVASNAALALGDIQGSLDATKIQRAQMRLRIARDRSTGCPDERAKVDAAQGAVAAVGGRLVAQSRQGLTSCDPQAVHAAARGLTGMSGTPNVAALERELWQRRTGLQEATLAIDRHKEAYNAARSRTDLDAMRRSVAALRDAASGAAYTSCFAADAERAGKIMGHIEAVARARDAAQDLLRSCKVKDAEPIISRLQRSSDTARTIAAKLQTQADTCTSENAAMQRRCTQAFGPGYTLSEISPDRKRHWCRPSQAAADRKCVEKHGAGYFARNITDRGQFSCVPNQATANRRCEILNKRKGAVATNIRPDGSFDCGLPRGILQAEAVADCRRQHGNMFLRVEWRGSRYLCRYCNRGFVPRGGRCVALARGPNVTPQARSCPPGTRMILGACQRPPTGPLPTHPSSNLRWDSNRQGWYPR